jgi:hypothetical protein
MTAPHYYSSTSGILLGAFERYGVYLLTYAGALGFYGKKNPGQAHAKAVQAARVVCSGFSAAVTTAFFGLESKMIDDTGREALSAAMGVDPDKIQFSDYAHSNNVILRSGSQQFLKLQKYRYGTDFLFMLPSLVEHVVEKNIGRQLVSTRDINSFVNEKRIGFDKLQNNRKVQHPETVDFLVKGSGWMDMSPYAAKAGYWAYETFMIGKTSYYEVVKLLENIEGTGKNMRADDLWGVYQRIRKDNKVDMIPVNAKEEYAAMWPLLTRLAEAYNKHDKKFNMPAIVYLLGEGKINIYAPDNATISQEAIAQSNKEIDKVLAIGLEGVRAENRRRHPMVGTEVALENSRNFTDRLVNRAVNTVESILEAGHMLPKRPIQPISPRDPAGLTELSSVTPNNGINR